jgi:uncharacterized protein YjbI with pentapeptide repeats
MANPEHLKILMQGVGVWNQWRKKQPGIKPDLSLAKLAGIKPDYNLNLSEADLSEADLSDAKLVMANLTRGNLFKADLCKADLSTATLAGATLSKAFLFGAKLTDADLTKANLSRATLSKANLAGANLSRATLIGANLFEANLWEANLEKANFTEANLSGANLTEANLSGAIFHQCHIGYTSFVNVNLKGVQNLETVKHVGPSYVAVSTIFNSGGDVPRVFLRGCGIPETFIQQLPSILGQSSQFASCFISFSYADRPFAIKLHDHLQEKGIRCWLDEHQTRPRDDSVQRAERGISRWDRILLCCSEAALKSWWVDKEVNKAFAKEQQLMQAEGKRFLSLIPINLDGYMFKKDCQSGRKDEILARLAADFTGWENDNTKFEEQFERVVKALMAGSPLGFSHSQPSEYPKPT